MTGKTDIPDIPASHALWSTAAAAGVFVVIGYLWVATVVLLDDPAPSGGACEMPPADYIVMEPTTPLVGEQSKQWRPWPRTSCSAGGETTAVTSDLAWLGLPVAALLAGATFWGVGRSYHRDEIVWEPD